MRVFTLAAAALCVSLTLGAAAVPITFDERDLFESDGASSELQHFGSFDKDDVAGPGDLFDVANFVHIDNVTPGNAVATVPEPPVMFLVLLGMLSLDIRQRREQMLLSCLQRKPD